MKQKEFIATARAIFAIVAVVHLVRAVLGWPVVIGDVNLPIWLSYVGAALIGYMTYAGNKLVK